MKLTADHQVLCSLYHTSEKNKKNQLPKATPTAGEKHLLILGVLGLTTKGELLGFRRCASSMISLYLLALLDEGITKV